MVDRRRIRVPGVGLVLMGLIAGLGIAWLLLPRFLTPGEAEDLRSVPEPEPITAEVEEGILREVIQLEGVVGPEVEVSVEAWQPVGAARPVLTFSPAIGSMVEAGQVIVAVSGRPLIFLGPVPNLYRDLFRGLAGPDVAGLQQLMIETGHLESDHGEDGVFGEVTEDGVEALYESLGYQPAPSPKEVTEEQMLVAQNTVDQAQQSLRAARQSGDRTSTNIAARSLAIASAQVDALSESPRLALPAAETLALPNDRIVVAGSRESVGSVVEAGGPLLDLRTENMVVNASTSRLRSVDLVTGLVAVITGAKGTLEAHLVWTGSDLDDPSQVALKLGFDAGSYLPGDRVIIEIETGTTVEPVVSVPVSAVRTDGDGESYVTVVSDEQRRRVSVSLGVTLGGRTAVRGALTPGQLVLVGGR